ncbi:MAG: lipopolysaccharide assembly protein LapA domain-containing protein [Gaiellaceae bacterium MAG52_C11]|nr:lipopolysaccharide assembly protein LapA domain-containing protein [Candidatus Gaiellasilicea maunaloa]
MDTPKREFERTWQPRLWLSLAALILIVAYVIAFIVGNSDETNINFVFAEATTSLIWVILLSLLAGLLGGVLVSQVYARRRALTGEPEPVPSPEPSGESEPRS